MPSHQNSLPCPICGQSQGVPPLKPGERALCTRCGTTLAECVRWGPDAALIFALTGLVLVVPSMLLPFVILRKIGIEKTSFLSGSFQGLWSHGGFGLLGAWVLFCGILAPTTLLALIVAIYWMDRHARLSTWNRRLRRLAEGIAHWAVPEVQVLAVMVAFFKLGDVVTVSVGPGLWCYGAASFFTLLAWHRLHLQLLEEKGPPTQRSPTAEAAALAVSAVILLYPAYALPVMHLGTVGSNDSDTTIFSGIMQLWRQGLGGLAAIVFTASFLVPLLKLTGLAWLLMAVWSKSAKHSRLLTRIYGAIDFIGRWSMLDVFLVAFLSGAVRFGALASVHPRSGIIAFASVVILTMLATRRFDPRLLWTDPRPA